jgi:hypothetical protein
MFMPVFLFPDFTCRPLQVEVVTLRFRSGCLVGLKSVEIVEGSINIG